MPQIDEFWESDYFIFVLQKLGGLKWVLSIRVKLDEGQKMYFVDFRLKGPFMF